MTLGVRLTRGLAVAVAVAAGACADGAPAVTAARIRVGYSGRADFADLPSLVAQDQLRARGYEVEATEYSAPDLAIDALSRGSVDIVHASMAGAWTAAARGARIRTIMNHVENPYRLVATAQVDGCRGLADTRLGIAAESAVSTHLVRAFLAEECQGLTLPPMVLMESMNRAALLLAGNMAVTALEVDALLWLETQSPGLVHVLSDFSERWPLLMTTGVHVNTRFAQTDDALVHKYVQALLASIRELTADPSRLVVEAEARFGASHQWPAIARAYTDVAAWPTDGGLTDDAVQATLAFFQEHGVVPAELTAAAVVDRSFLHGTRAGADE